MGEEKRPWAKKLIRKITRSLKKGQQRKRGKECLDARRERIGKCKTKRGISGSTGMRNDER